MTRLYTPIDSLSCACDVEHELQARGEVTRSPLIALAQDALFRVQVGKTKLDSYAAAVNGAAHLLRLAEVIAGEMDAAGEREGAL